MPKVKKNAAARTAAQGAAGARKGASRNHARKNSAGKTSGRSAGRSAGRNLGGNFGGWRARLHHYWAASLGGALVIVLTVVGIFWVGGYGGRVTAWAAQSSERAAIAAGLSVRTVTLRGAHNTAYADILEALGPVTGRSLAHVDLGEARARIESLGWVRSAAVSRLLPGTLHISVREREPAAIWQVNETLSLIDANGAIIRTVGGPEYSSLPLLVGQGAPQASSGILTALARYDSLTRQINAVRYVGRRRWDLNLRNGTTVKLPEENYAAALNSLVLMHAANGVLDQTLKYIDLRDPDRVVLRHADNSESIID